MTSDDFRLLAQQTKVFGSIKIGKKFILKTGTDLLGHPMISLEHANCGAAPLFSKCFCSGEIPNLIKIMKKARVISIAKNIEPYRVPLFSKECLQRIKNNKEYYSNNINRTFRDLNTMKKIPLNKALVLTTFWRIKNDR